MHIDLVIDADGHCNEPWEDLTPRRGWGQASVVPLRRTSRAAGPVSGMPASASRTWTRRGWTSPSSSAPA